jgi:hypothetical protein
MECVLHHIACCHCRKGKRVKYLVICILSLVTHLTARTPVAEARPASVVQVNALPASLAQPASLTDGALATLLGGALVALQLRRRQKSMRMPRSLPF